MNKALSSLITALLLVTGGVPASLLGAGYGINTGDLVIANFNGASVVKVDAVTGAQQALGGFFSIPTGVALDANGNVFVAEYAGKIKKLDLRTGTVTTLMNAGSGPSAVYAMTMGPDANLYLTSRGNHAVYRVDPATGTPTLITQGGSLYTPMGIAFLDNNHLVVCCVLTNNVVTISLTDNSQTVLAEGGTLDLPWGLSVSGGNVYSAAYDGKEVQRITPAGVVSTIATLSAFPYGMTTDLSGNLLIGISGAGDSVVRVSTAGAVQRTYSGPLIRWVTGLAVSPVSIPPPNTAPTLTPPNNQVVSVNTELTFTVVATDPEVPPQSLAFSLEPDYPTGASITLGGLFSWTPFDAQADTTNLISVTVTDNGSPPLSDTTSFSVIVPALNQPPVPASPLLERSASLRGKLPVSDFLGRDPDGDPVTLVSAGPVSLENGSVTILNDWVTYTPPTAFTGGDSFTFVVSDSLGALATGTASVAIRIDTAATLNLEIQPAGGDRVWLRGSGIPGRTYALEYTEILEPPVWVRLGTETADSFGQFLYLDTPAPSDPPRTYRAVEPQ